MTKPCWLLGIAFLVAGLGFASPGAAATRHHRLFPPKGAHGIVPMPAGATDPDKDAALILDGATGKVLYARNETAERHPASLTKMMTLYMLFEALRAGKLTMDTPMPVSVHAAQQKPTKLFLRPGETITVDSAIRALVIRSANDAAVVIAEALGGTELHFAQMMTDKARALGMKETYYHNASGLPDPLQITTAADLAMLARHLAYDFPQYFPYFGLPGFTYKGVYYPTHDNLIGRYPGADGIKTGFTVASGFNLTSSVVRNGAHLIGIVMGGRTALRRDLEMMHLLDITFAQIDVNPMLVARGPVPWEAVANAGQQPAVAGFTLAPQPAVPSTQFAALSAVPPPAITDTEDEDAAEARRAPDENFSIIHAEAPQLASAAQPARPTPVAAVPPAVAKAAAAPISAIRPSARPDMPEIQMASAAPIPAIRPVARPAQAEDAPAKSQQMAMFVPAPPPKPAPPTQVPAMRPATADLEQSASGHNWTIQIGAYANQALAKAQLDAYAQKSNDVLGQAARLVVPFQASDGKTMYRARFGLFAERQARQVCDRLTQRGQACFAAVAAR